MYINQKDNSIRNRRNRADRVDYSGEYCQTELSTKPRTPGWPEWKWGCCRSLALKIVYNKLTNKKTKRIAIQSTDRSTATPERRWNLLVLASASKTRADMLRACGVTFTVRPAQIDEDSITAALLAEGASPRDIADALAEMKAKRGAGREPQAVVVGVDQVLSCEGAIISKAATLAEAADTLRFLRGKTHELFSAAVIFEGNAPVWRHVGRARMHMRGFTDRFLQGYIERCGDAVLSSVGCYHIEGEGAQLFDKVEGDWFTVLGMPLLEILAFLRTRGLLPA